MAEEIFGRAELFQRAWHGLKKGSVQAVSGYWQHLQELTELVGGRAENWQEVAPSFKVTQTPRLFFCQGRPYYLWRKEEEVIMFSGLCPEDGNLLEWYDSGQKFRCAYCGRAIYLECDNIHETYRCKEANGKILVDVARLRG